MKVMTVFIEILSAVMAEKDELDSKDIDGCFDNAMRAVLEDLGLTL